MSRSKTDSKKSFENEWLRSRDVTTGWVIERYFHPLAKQRCPVKHCRILVEHGQGQSKWPETESIIGPELSTGSGIAGNKAVGKAK